MKKNYTHFTPLKTGRPKARASSAHRKRFSSKLSDNYKAALQIYCLNKTQASIKKELIYKKSGTGITDKTTQKSSISIMAWVAPFFNLYSNSNLIKKLRQGISMVTG